MGQNYQSRQGGNRNRDVPFPDVPESEIGKILGGNTSLLVDKAHEIGQHLAKEDGLTTSQLRNIFGEIRVIQTRWLSINPDFKRGRDELNLLRPKMAYFAKRAEKSQDKSEGLEHLRQVLDRAIIALNKSDEPPEEQIHRFIDFCEAIVAYHTRYASK